MRGEKKTKGQLIDDLAELRRRIAELEISETQRRRAAEALRESEEKYRSLVENSLDGIAIVQGNEIRFVNPALLSMLGYESNDEMIGHRFTDFVSPEYRDLLTERGLARERGEDAPSRYEFKALRKGGEQFDAELSVGTIKYEGRIARQGIIRDITERKQAEEALREEKHKAQTYLDVASVILLVIAADQTVTLVNQKGCDVLGYEEKEIIGKNWFDSFVPKSLRHEVKAVFAELMAGEIESVQYFENPVLTRSGEERVIAWHNTVLTDAEGNIAGILSSGEDITERKRAEELLQIQRDLGIALSATTGLDETLRLCLEAALRSSGLDCGGIYLSDQRSGGLDLQCHKGLSADFVQSASHYDTGSPSTRMVMGGKPVYSRHHELGIPLDDPRRRERLRAIAIVPVCHENKVIGCINVASHILDEVPGFARTALETIATQIANAIVRARVEEEVRRRNEELLAVHAIAEIMSQSLNLNDILNGALDKVLEIMEVEAGGICLAGENNGRLTLMAHRGVSEEFVKKVSAINVSEETVERVAEPGRAGKLILAKNLLKDRALLKAVTSAITREELCSYVQVLIRVKGAPAGLLVAASRTPRKFTAEEEELLSTIANQIGVAIENVSLYEEQLQRVFQMEALRKTTLDLTSQLDLDTLLHSIVSRAIKLLSGDAGGLYLYQPERNVLEWTVAIGQNLAPIGTFLQRGEDLSGRVWESGEPLMVDDYHNWEGRASTQKDHSYTTVIGVPVQWGRTLLGVLNVLGEPPRIFRQADADLLSLFALQAAIAIENATLYKTTKARMEELALLNRISTATTSTLNPQEVLDTIAREMAVAFRVEQCAIAVLNESRHQLTVTAEYLAPGRPSAFGDVIPVEGNPSTQQVLATRAPLAVLDAQEDPLLAPVHDLIRRRGAKSLLLVPLVLKDEVIGTIGVDFVAHQHRFTQEELALAQSIASQAAIAIENARLYEEAALRAGELKALYDVSLDLVGQLELPVLLRTITDRATELLGQFAGGLYLYDSDREELELVAAKGLWEDRIGVKLALGEGVCGKVVQTGEPLIVKDYANWEGVSPQFVGEQTFNTLAVPMKRGETLLGALYLNNPDLQSVFAEADVRLAALFANQAAIAIENARLLQERQLTISQLATLYDVSLEVVSQTDLSQLLTTIVQKAAGLLGADAAGMYFLDDEESLLRLSVTLGVSQEHAGTTLSLGEGLVGRVAQSRQPLAVDDYSGWEGRAPHWENAGLGAVLGVPVMRGNELLGVLAVDRFEASPFDQEDLWLASLFANQAAIAIENARLYKAQERRAKELMALHQTALDISGRLDLDTLLTAITVRATELLDATSGDIYLYRPGQGDLINVASHGMPPQFMGMTMKPGEGLSGKVFETGEPLAVHNYEAWYGRSEQYSGYGFARALAAPMRYQAQSLGVIVVDRPAGAPRFTEEDATLLGLFASQAAIAVQNARLYEETQLAARQLAALYDVSLEMIGMTGLSKVLSSIVENAVELLKAKAGAIDLCDPEAQELQLKVTHGYDDAYIGIRHAMGEGVVGRVAQTCQPLIVNDYSHWPGRSPQWKDVPVGAVLGLPLLRADQLLGVLTVDRDISFPFGSDDVRLAKLFANQAAIAIENARLVDALARHGSDLQRLSSQLINAQEEERKRISRELHDELGQALTAMSINIAAIEKHWPSEPDPLNRERLAETNSLIDRTLEQMRDLALDLRPSMLDDLGLLPTLRWYMNRYAARTDIEVEAEAIGLEERLASELETVLYRVVQEALTNVARHAQARHVRVHLERKESMATLLIEDDGKGFDVDEVEQYETSEAGTGLLGMRERVASLGGSFDIQSGPGRGTQVSVEIPLI